MSQPPEASDHKLRDLQRKAFRYFQCEVSPVNGLIIDKASPCHPQATTNWPSSIAAVGFALSSYPVAVINNILSHDEAVKRTLTTLRFFFESAHGPR
jgi:hypothetical protein